MVQKNEIGKKAAMLKFLTAAPAKGISGARGIEVGFAASSYHEKLSCNPGPASSAHQFEHGLDLHSDAARQGAHAHGTAYADAVLAAPDFGE